MRKQLLSCIAVLGLIALFPLSAPAKDVVINDGFETQGWQYWTPSGTLPTHETYVPQFDVTAPGEYSWCFATRVHDGLVAALTQDVYVEAGVTYTVRADFAYSTC